ncbi:MAG: hypothetical protein BWY87_01481 [Deltaproteobacteria bacterium ADurb.Bin510]|nr:MAG: hypothetical protein BWY87_01481 [Deltaproteobacteria bacterium ADurb.Bin510]
MRSSVSQSEGLRYETRTWGMEPADSIVPATDTGKPWGEEVLMPRMSTPWGSDRRIWPASVCSVATSAETG